jgi:ABC-type multidrug transport system ATPase subunit
MTPPVLRVEKLGFGYPGRRLFHEWSADFGPGLTWVCGGDGSGKTSLLKLLAGTLVGTGSIAIRGVRIDARMQAGHDAIAWCDPQTDAFDAVSANAYFEQLRATRTTFDGEALRSHIDGFDLAPHLAKPLYQLSTGSKRKVWIAGTLASGATVSLLDDPTAALDRRSSAHLMRTLESCAADPTRAWIVTGYERPPGLPEIACIRLPD